MLNDFITPVRFFLKKTLSTHYQTVKILARILAINLEQLFEADITWNDPKLTTSVIW